jgi:hypothetical protein
MPEENQRSAKKSSRRRNYTGDARNTFAVDAAPKRLSRRYIHKAQRCGQ